MCKKCSPNDNVVKRVPYDHYLKELTHYLTNGGVFLNTHGEKDNTMIIGWGGITYYWNKPIFLVPVRTSRYTWKAINDTGEFTVSVPLGVDLKKAIAFCGSKSGRDFDKFQESNLTPLPGKLVKAPVIRECTLHYECRVLFKQTMDPSLLDDSVKERHYRNDDFHTMFYGEILECYTSNTEA
ncbi:MAG TPA: flavin reductase [Clostridiales bacterium]|nr:flavin reductase family protein [Clostridia bacterium]MDD4679730.1 flavin reductase family protein [Clostridia bacterium]HCS75310.1 flavin reductase [Clostridiales bacterium]